MILTPFELSRLERQLGDLLEHITRIVNTAEISRVKVRTSIGVEMMFGKI